MRKLVLMMGVSLDGLVARSGKFGAGTGATSTADTAWRLCTRGITPEQAAGKARIDGDQNLASTALQIVSIIWSPPNPPYVAIPMTWPMVPGWSSTASM